MENNFIGGKTLNGITTSSKAIVLQTVRISGNDILNCQGGGSNTGFGTSGAIFLPDVRLNLLVHGNRLTGNTGIGMFLNGFSAKSEGQLLRLLVQDNSQDGNGTDKMVIAAGYAVQFTGNQCIEKIPGLLTHTLVDLTGQWLVVTGKTVLHNQSIRVQAILALYPHSSSASASAMSNILNGEPQIDLTLLLHHIITVNVNISV